MRHMFFRELLTCYFLHTTYFTLSSLLYAYCILVTLLASPLCSSRDSVRSTDRWCGVLENATINCFLALLSKLARKSCQNPAGFPGLVCVRVCMSCLANLCVYERRSLLRYCRRSSAVQKLPPINGRTPSAAVWRSSAAGCWTSPRRSPRSCSRGRTSPRGSPS